MSRLVRRSGIKLGMCRPAASIHGLVASCRDRNKPAQSGAEMGEKPSAEEELAFTEAAQQAVAREGGGTSPPPSVSCA